MSVEFSDENSNGCIAKIATKRVFGLKDSQIKHYAPDELVSLILDGKVCYEHFKSDVPVKPYIDVEYYGENMDDVGNFDIFSVLEIVREAYPDGEILWWGYKGPKGSRWIASYHIIVDGVYHRSNKDIKKHPVLKEKLFDNPLYKQELSWKKVEHKIIDPGPYKDGQLVRFPMANKKVWVADGPKSGHLKDGGRPLKYMAGEKRLSKTDLKNLIMRSFVTNIKNCVPLDEFSSENLSNGQSEWNALFEEKANHDVVVVPQLERKGEIEDDAETEEKLSELPETAKLFKFAYDIKQAHMDLIVDLIPMNIWSQNDHWHTIITCVSNCDKLWELNTLEKLIEKSTKCYHHPCSCKRSRARR